MNTCAICFLFSLQKSCSDTHVSGLADSVRDVPSSLLMGALIEETLPCNKMRELLAAVTQSKIPGPLDAMLELINTTEAAGC
eukprot:1138103-Pelagomonas_calceolata.AAC.4